MQIPPEISFHDMPQFDQAQGNLREQAEGYIRERIERLEKFCDYITSCRVTVEQPHRHQHKGNPFRVRVEVRIPPQKDLVAIEEHAPGNKEYSDGYPQPVIRAAFQSMERQLKKVTAQTRNAPTGIMTEEPRGLVVRLFADEGYGFLRTPDGREFYFHRHSVLHDDFERMTIGTEVRFVEQMGEMGPQASSVQILNKPGVRESNDTAIRSEIPPGWRND